MRRTLASCLVFGLAWLAAPVHGPACSCAWRGPFLTVAREAPLVVWGRILRHHPGPAPCMDVLVLETLAGGLLDSGLVVQMGDGMLCRPTVDGFPAGSEWILALNGPGSKPGAGLALSHCGEYWLALQDGIVRGSIDGVQNQLNAMPWQEFKARFKYPAFSDKIAGQVAAGERFRCSFGSRFEFLLEPKANGWEIVVREFGREENLARLTPPLHFVPNPREIEGWQLSPAPGDCLSRPYGAEVGPANPRQFIFSPEVGVGLAGEKTNRAISADDVAEIGRFGRGTLRIDLFKLAPGENGCPKIEWLKFSVQFDGGH